MPTYTFHEAQINARKQKKDGYAEILLPPIDGVTEGALWGRLTLDFAKDADDVVLAFAEASDRLLPEEDIRSLLTESKPFVNQRDSLLYDKKGRYLYIAVVCRDGGRFADTGKTEKERKAEIGEPILRAVRVSNPGDRFMATFPELYRERNSVFHRYISIFSSIYDDLGDKIERVDEYLDADTAPAELLEEYARWLGVRLTVSLPEETLRGLVKNAYELNRRKGTAWALKKLVEIVTGRECRILERSRMTGAYTEKEKETIDRLYGSRDDCVTVLIEGKKDGDDAALFSLLTEYAPVQVTLRVEYVDRGDVLDAYSFLSANAALYEEKRGRVDEGVKLGGSVRLQ